MKDNRICLYVGPREGDTLVATIDHTQLSAVRALIAAKGLLITEEFISVALEETCFDEMLYRVEHGKAAGILKLNPPYLSDLPRIESLLNAHMEVENRTGFFEPWEVGHFMLSRRLSIENESPTS